MKTVKIDISFFAGIGPMEFGLLLATAGAAWGLLRLLRWRRRRRQRRAAVFADPA